MRDGAVYHHAVIFVNLNTNSGDES